VSLRAILGRLARKGAARARREHGFTLIESIVGMLLFAFIAVGLVGLLTSSIAANDLSRQKTVGQQLAQDQVEDIRRLDYDDVGTVSGNPPGVVVASRTVTSRGYDVTITTQIQYVNDPTPTSYATAANYKKVTVTVTSNRNGRVLASVVTFIAPPSRAPFGGLNNAIINVTTKDLQTTQPLGNAAVVLSTGPSAPRNDVTDATTGLVTFAGLTPNPTSGGSAFYDIAVTKSGYETYVDYISPAAPAHVQLAPSQTLDTTILLYRPITITVNVNGTSGAPYSGTATVKLSSERSGTTQSYTATGGSTSAISTFAGRPTAPGNFTAYAYTSTGLCADPVTQLAWDDYPNTLASAITVDLQPCPMGSLTVNVTQLGGPAVGATVQVSGGPNDITTITNTTDATGAASFANLPSGTDPYQITVTDAAGNVTANGTVVITTGPPATTTTINLNDPPMGSITALVRAAGANVNGATVQVTGGPYGITSATLTTSGSGSATFSNNIPAGTGYTVTAVKSGQTVTSTGVSVTSGSTTTVTLNMPTGTIDVAATWAGLAAGNVGGTPSVTVTGGPAGATYNASISNSGGTVSIVVPATDSSTPYQVTVTKNGGSGTTTGITVPSGGSAPAAVALTPVKTLTLTIQAPSGTNIPNQPITVSLTDGPNGSANVAPAYTPVATQTDGNSRVVLTVPVQSTGTYTVKVYRTGCPGSTNRSRTTTVSAAAGTTTATIALNTSTCPITTP
jgi:type II secretory pathway pseudopilin PulG